MGAMTGLLLLLWAGVTVGSVLDLQKRVIRGRDCLQGERQYHVKLKSRNPTHESICGGSLISNQWILTAAHCWMGRGWTMTAHLDGSTVGVVITEHVIYKDKIIRTHDIMLLKLRDVITDITPVDLPVNCPLKPGDKVQVAGYGLTAIDATNLKVKGPQGEPAKLQCGDMNVVNCAPIEKCLKKKLFSWSSIDLWLCYKDKAGIVDVASGDSGEGVVVGNMIYGVHVHSFPEACVGPAISMNVCHGEYLDWIYKNTGIPKPKQSGPG